MHNKLAWWQTEDIMLSKQCSRAFQWVTCLLFSVCTGKFSAISCNPHLSRFGRQSHIESGGTLPCRHLTFHIVDVINNVAATAQHRLACETSAQHSKQTHCTKTNIAITQIIAPIQRLLRIFAPAQQKSSTKRSHSHSSLTTKEHILHQAIIVGYLNLLVTTS